MVDDDDLEWTDYAITQANDSDSWKITVIPEFGGKFEDTGVSERISGNYLIVKPQELPEDPPIELELRQEIENWSDEEKAMFLQNILQGYCIAGVSVIDLQYPEWESDTELMVDNILYAASRLAGSFDRTEKRFEINRDVSFEEYVVDVSDFLSQYLLRALEIGIDNINSDEMKNDEMRIDTNWALSARSAQEVFFEFKITSYPQELCGLYIGKYLEEMVDESQKLVGNYNHDEMKNTIVQEFTSDLHSVLNGDSPYLSVDFGPKRFDDQIQDIALESYDLEADESDFIIQNKIFQDRKKAIDSIRNNHLKRLKNMADDDDVSKNEVLETCIFIGECTSIIERIIRIPVSISIVGAGAEKISRTHTDFS